VNGAEPWRYAVLLLPPAAFVVLAVVGFVRRDIRAA
jgi:hypothetical protein